MDDDRAMDARRNDPIVKSGIFATWMICIFFIVLAIFGLVRFPHWIWSAPIVVALAALGVNVRQRSVPPGWTALLFAVLLVLVVGAGALLGVADRVSH